MINPVRYLFNEPLMLDRSIVEGSGECKGVFLKRVHNRPQGEHVGAEVEDNGVVIIGVDADRRHSAIQRH
jgi:hypothetical protein